MPSPLSHTAFSRFLLFPPLPAFSSSLQTWSSNFFTIPPLLISESISLLRNLQLVQRSSIPSLLVRSFKFMMEPDLIFGEVADKNRAFEDADEDAFIFEEIRDSSDDQQVEHIMMLQPKKGMTFDSEDAAVSFYKDYAKKEGFGVIRRTTRHGEYSKLVYFTLACNRQGKAQYSSKNSFKPNPSTRMQCPAKINFSRHEEKFR
uniref:FAR1 domain-containing protein n=1 Tax=Aegilops tauschii subsp. strangulata TaxID=200361 RepID=A0A453HXH0_AEGTS